MVEITLSKYLWMRKLPDLSIWIHLMHGSVCLRQAYNSLGVLLRLCPIRIWKNYILEELHFILFPEIVTRQKYKLIQKKNRSRNCWAQNMEVDFLAMWFCCLHPATSNLAISQPSYYSWLQNESELNRTFWSQWVYSNRVCQLCQIIKILFQDVENAAHIQ